MNPTKEKRRKARIQGGWASHSVNIKSDRDKPKAAVQPAWLGKNIDLCHSEKYVYEMPTEDLHSKAKVTTIEKTGVYDISLEPSGVSRLRLFTNFIDQKECQEIHDQLLQELPWRQKTEQRNNDVYQQPRLTAWYGEHPYSYSVYKHESNTKWPILLEQLRERLEENTGMHFNSVLANLYRDGHDLIPWHSDNEEALGPSPTIASLTFGDCRIFELRKNPPADKAKAGDYSLCDIIKIPLDAGTLLIMEGATQDDWEHRIPREYHDRGPRINLTFRVIYPEERKMF
ncbi:hypothetical protein LSH36_628g02031 [Paralvinella palmiformis]|uniref:Alpha-ketoglutarate-dependent dioxygenase alkB homolog 3 n=1 Tax=Paralvinella palmiformis TaxID=53620 RepID=A0AAD9MW80_9ANNE|nr:hypothetical protein LSH36_628g02031 [Paralvinella palmiformis]